MKIKGLRKAIARVNPYQGGKTIEEVKRELGIKEVIKLGSNENPYGPFPVVKEAMKKELDSLNCYPDVNFKEIKKLITDLYGVTSEWTAVSHGAEGMLQTLGKCFIEEGDEVIIPDAAYGLYKEISRLMGAKVIETPMKEYAIDLNAVRKAITPKTKLIWLANPNNPTGTVFPIEDFHELLDCLPETVWVVLDEAYAEFADGKALPDCIDLIRCGKRLVCVRTFSKAYGLAGARLGYALADPDLITVIDTVSEPFNANRIGIAGATSVLTEGLEEYREAMDRLLSDRRKVEKALLKMGMSVVPSSANFVFFKTPCEADYLANELLVRGIIVRPCGFWGYPNHLRVTVGTSEQNHAFLKNLSLVLDEIALESGGPALADSRCQAGKGFKHARI